MFNDIIQLLLVIFLFIIIYNIFNYLFPLREGWWGGCGRGCKRGRRRRKNQQRNAEKNIANAAPNKVTQGFSNIEGFHLELNKTFNNKITTYKDNHGRGQSWHDDKHRKKGGSWENWKTYTTDRYNNEGMQKLRNRRNNIIVEINNSIKNKTTPEGYNIGEEYWKFTTLLENTELKKELESMVTNTNIKDSKFKIDYKNKLEGFLKTAYEENRNKTMNTYTQGEGSAEIVGDYFTNFTEGFDSSTLSYPDDLGQYSEIYMMNDGMQMEQLNKIKNNYNISEEDAKKKYYETSLSYLEDWHQKLGELTKQKAIAGTQIKLGGGA